jgi:hypothetical protein
MEYTYDEYCDMLLTLGDCNSRAGTDSWEYALRYPCRRHPDANMFRRLEQRLRDTGSVTPTALMNAGRPRTVRTPANEDAIIAAVEREPWRSSRDIARELGLSQPRILEVLHDDQLHPYHNSRSAHLFPDDRSLRKQFCEWLQQHAADELFFTQHSLGIRSVFYAWGGGCSTSTTVTSGHGIIPMLSANVGIKSGSASAFELVSSGTLSWAPICYLTGWLLNYIVIFWKLFYRGCLKMCL